MLLRAHHDGSAWHGILQRLGVTQLRCWQRRRRWRMQLCVDIRNRIAVETQGALQLTNTKDVVRVIARSSSCQHRDSSSARKPIPHGNNMKSRQRQPKKSATDGHFHRAMSPGVQHCHIPAPPITQLCPINHQPLHSNPLPLRQSADACFLAVTSREKFPKQKSHPDRG